MKLSHVPLIQSVPDSSIAAGSGKRPRLALAPQHAPAGWVPPAATADEPAPKRPRPTPASAPWTPPTPPGGRRPRAGEQNPGNIWIASTAPLFGPLAARLQGDSLEVRLPNETLHIPVSPTTVGLYGAGPLALHHVRTSSTGRSWYFRIEPASAEQIAEQASSQRRLTAKLPHGNTAPMTDARHFVCMQPNSLALASEALYLRRKLDADGATLGFICHLAHLREPLRQPAGKLVAADVTCVELDLQLRPVRRVDSSGDVWIHATLGFHELAEFYGRNMDGPLIAQRFGASLGLLQILGRQACDHGPDTPVTRDVVSAWFKAMTAAARESAAIKEVACA